MNVKSIVLLSTALLFSTTVSFGQKKKAKEPQELEGFKFETVISNPITSIKNQSSSGTCWCFSALSFFESEILKAGYKEPLDLAEMFVVSHAYADKAEKYVRLHGNLNFGPGSSFGDALVVMKKYGIVPNSEMEGLNYGTQTHNHGEMDDALLSYVGSIIKSKKPTIAWKKGFQGILDAYLGERPETFKVNGKEYTPKSYMESLPIDLNDYVDITSFTHHPFYEKMVIEVPDNWRWEEAYNVTIDDMVAIIDNALTNGYTVAWASDVSEKGFTRDGIGIIPDEVKIKEAAGSDQAKWTGVTTVGGKMQVTSPVPEMTITQEMRQEAFDNYQTTDDHGMHIFGIAKDQNGTKYYMVKNSWGETGKYKGCWYISEAFIRYKTTDFMVNKNAIPAEIRAKLGL